jgi:hypothetical protein
MILRNLADALRNQNWFTVVLEVLIVVVGIFIGLQVDGWNEARKDRVSEHRYLERIYDELALDIESIEQSIRIAKSRREMGQLLLRALDDSEVVRADPHEFMRAIQQASYTFSPTINDHTFDEIKFAGNLAIIRDVELRSGLSAYYKLIERYDQWAYIRAHDQNSYTDRQQGILTVAQTYELVLFGDTVQFTVADALPALERMRGKADFVAQIPQSSNHAFAILTYGSWLDAAQNLRDRIAVALGYQ